MWLFQDQLPSTLGKMYTVDSITESEIARLC